MCRDCEPSLGGWLLRRAPECQVCVSRLRRTPRGLLLRRAPECQVYVSRLRRMPREVAASASPRVPSLCVAIEKNASRGGCCGEPPSAKFMCRDCEERLGGWLLSASSRVPSLCVAIAKNASWGG